MGRRIALVGALCAVTASAIPVSAAHAETGPNSAQSPYLLPFAGSGVHTKSILTVGDSVGGYRMVGIPDGLGAIDKGDGSFNLLMNHELRETLGTTRAHGAIGSFVSSWTINSTSLAVTAGSDLIQKVATWNEATTSFNSPASGVLIGRMCSADLAPLTAYYNPKSKRGYNGRIFMNGEETGSEGRAFAHLLNGTSYELPHLGKFSWENSVAHPNAGNKTVVMGTDDTTPGEVYVYLGKKSKKGGPMTQAGLVGGDLYGVVVDGVPDEDRTTGIGTTTKRFRLQNHGDVSGWTGLELQAADDATGVTAFLRPEDGAWDPANPNDFYFVTTDRFDQVKAGVPATPPATAQQVGRSRLWRLSFDNVQDPAAGGNITMLIDGTEAHQMFDNMTMDRYGHVLLQEDPGGQDYLARVWQYSVATDNLKPLAQHDPARFLPGAASFLTRDEESSGIIDAEDILGPGWFLLDVQAHYSIAGELVEGGQLLALYNPDTAAAAATAR
ncbi:MAG: DUF839 domain-containing protein [Chloroflexota bacterium]|nr:DUF839 domain-containing protein [Chloroflexota bacterium]